MKSAPGPPATLGSTAEAHLRLIVWCKTCRHQLEPDPAEMAERYGAEMTVPEWRKRLVCSQCGSREIDMMAGWTLYLLGLRPGAPVIDVTPAAELPAPRRRSPKGRTVRVSDL